MSRGRAAWAALWLRAAALPLLAFGAAMLFATPKTSGPWRQGYEKAVWGALPAAAGIALLRAAWRRLARRRGAAAIFAGLLVAVAAGETVLAVRWEPDPDERLRVKWDAARRVFSWGSEWVGGAVRIPAGLYPVRLTGMDTAIGEFRSAGGEPVLQYDIGMYAGEHGSVRGEERLVEGLRVRTQPGAAAFSDCHSSRGAPAAGHAGGHSGENGRPERTRGWGSCFCTDCSA